MKKSTIIIIVLVLITLIMGFISYRQQRSSQNMLAAIHYLEDDVMLLDQELKECRGE